MRAWMRSVVVGGAVLAGSTCIAVPVLAGTSDAAGARSHVTAQSDHNTNHNRRVANHDALQLLQLARLPSGATPSSREPAGDAGALKDAPVTPGTPNLVDDPEWWTVNESPQQVMSYVKAHPPSGGHAQFSGGQEQCTPNSSPPSDCHTITTLVGFVFRPEKGVLGLRQLVVEVAQLGDGSTGVRADAEVVWISTRPPGDKVPHGVREVDVAKTNPGQGPSVSKQVTSRAQVRRIVKLINHLPITQPGVYHCPHQRVAPVDRFTFRAADGTVLAKASVRSSVGNTTTNCDAMSFSINGHSEPGLGKARSFLQAVGRLLGVQLTSQ